jgi:hypothetical protein
VIAAIFVTVTANVAAAADQEEQEPKAWYDRMQIYGDLRLRYEGFLKENEFDEGRRDRFRYRLRAGLRISVIDAIRLGIQLRSGNPQNPVSDNQSFDGGFDKDRFSIAEVYADFTPSKSFSVIAGKFPHRNLWSVSDLHWDYDVVVAGALQSIQFGGAEGGLKSIGVSVYQYVLDESSLNIDSYIFGGQIRPSFRFGAKNELEIGAGFDYFVNPQSVANLTLSGALAGNFMTNLVDQDFQLISDFHILNLLGVWENNSSSRWPLKASLYYYKNFGAKNMVGTETGITDALGNASENDTAFFGRVEVGGYSKLYQLQFRYSYYYSEPDGLFYAYLQSDTRRASNLDGHRLDVRLGMPARTYFNFTWYNTRPKLGEDSTMNRWQFDYVIRF